MKPAVLRCPSCGAASETPASARPAPCAYCKAALHPARCPWCFTWGFSESATCAVCQAQTPPEPGPPLSCPSCREPLSGGRSLEGARLDGCPSCGGVWTDPASFRRLCEDRAAKAPYLGESGVLPAPKAKNPASSPMRYRPCAVCAEMMNRVNFAGASGVIIDVCKPHGTWFDAEELAAIAAFVRQGGLDAVREREMRRLEEEFMRLRRAARPDASGEVSARALRDSLASARGLLKTLFAP